VITFRRSNLRWLLVVAAIPVAIMAYAVALYVGMFFLQEPYFSFIDALNRVTLRRTDSLGVLLLSTPLACAVFTGIIGASVAMVSKRSRPFILPIAVSVSVVAAEASALLLCGVPWFSKSEWAFVASLGLVPLLLTAVVAGTVGPSFAIRKVTPLSFAAAYVILCPAIVILNSTAAPAVRVLKPAWQTEIKSYGWSSWTNDDAFSATRRLTFLDSSALAVGFEGDTYYESASVKMPKRPQHALTMDAATGRVMAHKDWVGGFSYVFGTSKDAFVLAGQDLELLTKSLESLSTFALPSGSANNVSPNGQRIAWETSVKNEPGVILIDTADLKPAVRLPTIGVLWTMSDKTIATGGNIIDGRPAIEVYGNTGREILYQTPANDTCGLSPHYLSNDLMLIIRCDHLMLFDTAKKQVVRDEIIGTHMDFAGVSRAGKRFALSNSRWGFGDPSYLKREEIIVYDTATLRPISKVLSDPLPRNQSWSALSPDGRFIATGSGGVVKLFRID
jgi:hypothetical protein